MRLETQAGQQLEFEQKPFKIYRNNESSLLLAVEPLVLPVGLEMCSDFATSLGPLQPIELPPAVGSGLKAEVVPVASSQVDQSPSVHRLAGEYLRLASIADAGVAIDPETLSLKDKAKAYVRNSPQLVVETLKGFVHNLTSLFGYKKRLRALENELATKRTALENASAALDSLPESDREVASKKIISLQRDLDLCLEEHRALKESRFRMASASNSALETSASAVKLVRFVANFAGALTGAAATTLNYTLPGLGIVTSSFWAVFSGVMGHKAWKAYRETQAELERCEAELFLTEEPNRKRAADFLVHNSHQIPTGEPSFRKRVALHALVQSEYKQRLAEFESSDDGERLAQQKKTLASIDQEMKQSKNDPLTLSYFSSLRSSLEKQIAILESARPRPIPITLETIDLFRAEKPMVPLTPLFAKCAAINKASLEKKVAVLTQEKRKQIVKVCHYAVHVGMAVLGITAGALAIAATAGAATPVVAGAALGVFVLVFPAEAGLFGTDAATSFFDRAKGKEERKIPRSLAAAQLAHEISLLSDEEREAGLAAASLSLQKDETQILKQLAAFSGPEIERIAICMHLHVDKDRRNRILQAVGLDQHVSPSVSVTEYLRSLAHEISELDVDGQQDALRSLGILPEADLASRMTEADLLRYLTSRLSLLFPKDKGEKVRHLLASYGFESFSTPKELASLILALPEDERHTLLEKLEIPNETGKGKTLTPERLSVRLKSRFPYLFPKISSKRLQGSIEIHPA